MSRTSQLLALGLVAVVAAGCTKPPLTNSEAQLYSAEARYPIAVEPQVAMLAVRVDDGLQSIGRGEEERVRAFVNRWKMRGQGMMNAASPSEGANREAVAGAISQLKRLFAAQGLDMGAVRYTSYKPAKDDAQAPITLSFVTYVANAAECGTDWTENLGFTPRNQPWPEFGCSTQRNLAAIVADPRDLMEPQASDPVVAGTRRGDVMDKYNAGLPTQTTKSDDANGNVSTVSQ